MIGPGRWNLCLLAPQSSQKATNDRVRRRQLMAGWTVKTWTICNMAEGGKEAVGSMGDDTPLAVLSNRYRGLQFLKAGVLAVQSADR